MQFSEVLIENTHFETIFNFLVEDAQHSLEICWSHVLVCQLLLTPALLRLLLDDREPPRRAHLLHAPTLLDLPIRRHRLGGGWGRGYPQLMSCRCPWLPWGLLGQEALEILFM